jgi:hypothetical protein
MVWSKLTVAAAGSPCTMSFKVASASWFGVTAAGVDGDAGGGEAVEVAQPAAAISTPSIRAPTAVRLDFMMSSLPWSRCPLATLTDATNSLGPSSPFDAGVEFDELAGIAEQYTPRTDAKGP